MGVISYDQEIKSSFPPAKVFKATILDGDNLFPKILPQAIKSVETIQGDGGVGTIKLMTLGEASPFNSVKHRVDGIDKENFSYSYSIIEGDVLMGILESISYVIKIEASADGGSICKTTGTYYTKTDAQITEEQIEEGKKQAIQMYQVIEAYLQANPDAYN